MAFPAMRLARRRIAEGLPKNCRRIEEGPQREIEREKGRKRERERDGERERETEREREREIFKFLAKAAP